MKIKTLVINALVAAMYMVVTALVAPFGFANIQFRLSELFNHLIVLNKKYFFGIVIGVLLANFFFAPMKQDMIFGVLHTVLSLGITLFFCRFIKSQTILMFIYPFDFYFYIFYLFYFKNVFKLTCIFYVFMGNFLFKLIYSNDFMYSNYVLFK